MSEKHTQKGFTIVELMIATAVFGVVLLVAAGGVVAIGRMYHKGITTSRVQEATRSVTDTVSRTVQFTDESMSTGGSFPEAQSYCFGYDRYTYKLDSQVSDDSDAIGLRHDRRSSLGVCSPNTTPLSDDDSITEFLPNNTRLLDFQINEVNSESELYKISVKIAYGDNDLLTIYDNSGNPTNSSGQSTTEELRGAGCKPGIAGSHFCGISELETVVGKRVE